VAERSDDTAFGSLRDGKRRGASLPAAVQKLFASSPNTRLLSWVKGNVTHEPEISFGKLPKLATPNSQKQKRRSFDRRS
jgi:hypothetical protein